MIEVHHMVVDVLGTVDEIPDDAGILGNRILKRVFYRTHRGNRMVRRADPAYALGEGPGVPRITATQDGLDPTYHGSGAGGPGDDAIGIRLGFDTEMPLNAGDRINDDRAHNVSSSCAE